MGLVKYKHPPPIRPDPLLVAEGLWGHRDREIHDLRTEVTRRTEALDVELRRGTRAALDEAEARCVTPAPLLHIASHPWNMEQSEPIALSKISPTEIEFTEHIYHICFVYIDIYLNNINIYYLHYKDIFIYIHIIVITPTYI